MVICQIAWALPGLKLSNSLTCEVRSHCPAAYAQGHDGRSEIRQVYAAPELVTRAGIFRPISNARLGVRDGSVTTAEFPRKKAIACLGYCFSRTGFRQFSSLPIVGIF